MSTKLTYSKSGKVPQRTARSIAKQWGAKVPDAPQMGDYCPVHGSASGSCGPGKHDEDAQKISESGGSSKLPSRPVPFKVGG